MRAAVLALLLGAVALPAAAAPVDFFAKYRLTTGPLAGEQVVLSLTVDDSLLTTEYSDIYEPAGLAILDITATSSVPGLEFTAINAGAFFLAFQYNKLVEFGVGGTPSGLDLVDSSDVNADFIADSFAIGYKLAGADEFIYEGELEFLAAPTPATLALLGLGAATLVMRRRV